MANGKGISLTSLNVFKGIPEKELVTLYNSFLQKKLKANEIVVKEGASLNALILIVAGAFEVTKKTEQGEIAIGLLKSNHVYGALTAEFTTLSAVTLVAKETSTVIMINEKSLALLKPDLKTKLLVNISAALSVTDQYLYSLLTPLSLKVYSLASALKDLYEQKRSFTSSSKILLERLKKIPSLPPYTYELSSMLLRENISSDKIVEHIKSDPSLMALVLKTVNSSYYNLSQRVSDFHHAVMLLGFGQIYQIVMDNSLNNIMPQRPDFIELRDSAVAVSNIAFEIAMLSGYQRPLLLNTIGTMYVIGKAIIIILKKEQDFAEIANLFDDAWITSMMLKGWKMPEIIYKSIDYYKYAEYADTGFIPADVAVSVAILHVSIACVETLKGGQPSDKPFLDNYMGLLGLSDSIYDLTFKKILPSLRKRSDMLPRALQNLIAEGV